jgi:hypothetical protein
MNDRIIKQIDKAINDLQAAKDDLERIKFSRLPDWMQANEIGDRLKDSSDSQEYDEPEREYPEDVR